MENLISVLEEYLRQLDGSNINPVTEEDSMYSNITFTVQGVDYRQNSVQIQEFFVEEYNPEDEFIEFALRVQSRFNILFEGDDYSEASHDSEDDAWYGVETVSEEHTYEVAIDLNAQLNLEDNSFEILEPISQISIDVDVNEFTEE